MSKLMPVMMTKADVLDFAIGVLERAATSLDLVFALAGAFNNHPDPVNDPRAMENLREVRHLAVDEELQKRALKDAIEELRALVREERILAARVAAGRLTP